ncbi:MAG: hypothetical protein ACRCSB_05730 [Bacteroidales bacterium]
MKSHKNIIYLFIAVYSVVLLHNAVPHTHYVCDSNDEIVCNLADFHTHTHHEQEHFPEHHHAEDFVYYLITNSTTNPIVSQCLLTLHAIPSFFNFHVLPNKLAKLAFYYPSLKIPVQFSFAVPLRAPPAC